MDQGQKKVRNRLENLVLSSANWTVRLTGSVIFLLLVWYSLRYTQYMVPMEGHEFPIDMKDSMFQNIVAAALFTALAAGLLCVEKHFSEKTQKWIVRGSVAFAMLWQGVWGFLWITAADRCPKGDQAIVFNSAAAFLKDNYSILEKGAYCDLYPHQLGLAALEEGMFRLLGDTGYYAFQFLFVLMAAGTVYFSCRLISELTEHTALIVLACLLHVLCAAPILYTCWVYGEIPYVFFTMLAARMLAGYAKRGRVGSLAVLVLALAMAVLVRKNAMILIVAFCLTGLVTAFAKRDGKLLAAVVLSVLLPAMLFSGIYKM